jgi:hypothetical protein
MSGSGDDDDECEVDTFSDVSELQSDEEDEGITPVIGHATETTDFMQDPIAIGVVELVVTLPNGVLLTVSLDVFTRTVKYCLATVTRCPVSTHLDVGDVVALTPDCSTIMSTTAHHKAILELSKLPVALGGVLPAGGVQKGGLNDKKLCDIQKNPPKEWSDMFKPNADHDGVDRVVIMSTKLQAKLTQSIMVAERAKKAARVAKAAAKAIVKPPVSPAPVKAVVKTTPVAPAPVTPAPVKTMPVKTTPVKTMPVKTTPVKTTPVTPAPVKETAKPKATKCKVASPARSKATVKSKRPASDMEGGDTDAGKRCKTDTGTGQVTISFTITAPTMTEAMAKYKRATTYDE